MGLFSSLTYYTRSTVAIVLLCLCALYGVFASIVLICFGNRHLAQWTTARSFYYVIGSALGIKVKVINGENLKKLPAILVANHQSELDVLILGRVFPRGCTVTAKNSLKYVPFLGWFMTLSGTLFLKRGNTKNSIATLNKALKELRSEKRALWVFPEGTRPYSTKLCTVPFKKGAFHLAQQGKIPIVPVIISNTSTILSPKLGIFNRGTITVKVLDPISTEDLTKEGVTAFSEKVRDLMDKEIKKLGYSEACNDTGLPKEALSEIGHIAEYENYGDDDSTVGETFADEIEIIAETNDKKRAEEPTETTKLLNK